MRQSRWVIGRFERTEDVNPSRFFLHHFEKDFYYANKNWIRHSSGWEATPSSIGTADVSSCLSLFWCQTSWNFAKDFLRCHWLALFCSFWSVKFANISPSEIGLCLRVCIHVEHQEASTPRMTQNRPEFPMNSQWIPRIASDCLPSKIVARLSGSGSWSTRCRMRGTCGLPGTWRTPITTCRGSLARSGSHGLICWHQLWMVREKYWITLFTDTLWLL